MINDHHIRLPKSWCVPDTDTLLDAIYPGIDSVPPPPPDYFLNCMILAPQNANVQDMNEQILKHMPGQAQQYINQVIQEAGAGPTDAKPIPIKFLRSVNASTLPPGELNLKVGCPVILL